MDAYSWLHAVWADDRGQDLVEYVLLLLLVTGVVAAALLAFGGQLQAMFGDAAETIGNQG